MEAEDPSNAGHNLGCLIRNLDHVGVTHRVPLPKAHHATIRTM